MQLYKIVFTWEKHILLAKAEWSYACKLRRDIPYEYDIITIPKLVCVIIMDVYLLII